MPYYLFVVDRERRLVGVVSLRQLLVASPTRLIGEIMDPDVISVPAGTDQEEVANLMKKYDLLALPVVDAQNRLLGIITVDDVVDVIEEETTEDVYRLGAVEPGVGRQPYFKTSILQVVRSRIGWLVLLLLAETLTGSALRAFEEELATVVALTFFIPLLIDAGGNTGSQTVSMIIRGLCCARSGRTTPFVCLDASWLPVCCWAPAWEQLPSCAPNFGAVASTCP
jgi:magnesium transporter